MSPLPDRLLTETRFYLPWNPERPVHRLGLPLAKRLQSVHDKPLTVVCLTASNLPIGLATTKVVTERDGSVTDGGVVLAYCPSYQLARKFVHLTHSVIIVAEWSNASYRGWARVSGAHNIVTGESLNDGLTGEGLRCVSDIVACGDLSWTDAPARNTVNSCLDRLVVLEQFSPEVLLAHARIRWGARPVRNLDKLLGAYIPRRASDRRISPRFV